MTQFERLPSGDRASAPGAAGGVRHALQNARGPIGVAVTLTVLTILIASLESWFWATRNKAPNPTALVVLIITIGMWRPVAIAASDTATRRFQYVRISLLILVALCAIVGMFQLHWRGVALVIPLLAAWNVVLEFVPPFRAGSGARQ